MRRPVLAAFAALLLALALASCSDSTERTLDDFPGFSEVRCGEEDDETLTRTCDVTIDGEPTTLTVNRSGSVLDAPPGVGVPGGG